MNLANLMPSDRAAETDEMQDIVMIGYTSVGKISGIGNSLVQVEAREVLIPDRNVANYSVRIELNSGGDYSKEAAAHIKLEDVDRLISMLRRLENTSISVDRFALSEVQYEISDLKIIVFNTHHGSTMAAIQSGSVSIHLNSPTKLGTFTALIEEARDHLQAKRLA